MKKGLLVMMKLEMIITCIIVHLAAKEAGASLRSPKEDLEERDSRFKIMLLFNCWLYCN